VKDLAPVSVWLHTAIAPPVGWGGAPCGGPCEQMFIIRCVGTAHGIRRVGRWLHYQQQAPPNAAEDNTCAWRTAMALPAMKRAAISASLLCDKRTGSRYGPARSGRRQARMPWRTSRGTGGGDRAPLKPTGVGHR